MCVTPGAAATSGALSIETALAPSLAKADDHQPSLPPTSTTERACTRSWTTTATAAALRAEPARICGWNPSTSVGGRLRRRAHGGMAAVEQEPWVDAPPAASLECLDTLAKRRRVPQQALVLGHEIELVHVGTIRLEMLA